MLDMRPVAEAEAETEDEEDVWVMPQKVVPEGKKKYEVYKKEEEFKQKFAGEKSPGMPVDFHASQQLEMEATLLVGANPRTSSTAADEKARRDVSVSVGRLSADDLQKADLFQDRERKEVSTRLSVLEQSFRLQRKFEGGTAGRKAGRPDAHFAQYEEPVCLGEAVIQSQCRTQATVSLSSAEGKDAYEASDNGARTLCGEGGEEVPDSKKRSSGRASVRTSAVGSHEGNGKVKKGVQRSAAKTRRRRTEIASSLTSKEIQDKEEAADDQEEAVGLAASDGNLSRYREWLMHRFKYQTHFFNKTEDSKDYEETQYFNRTGDSEMVCQTSRQMSRTSRVHHSRVRGDRSWTCQSACGHRCQSSREHFPPQALALPARGQPRKTTTKTTTTTTKKDEKTDNNNAQDDDHDDDDDDDDGEDEGNRGQEGVEGGDRDGEYGRCA